MTAAATVGQPQLVGDREMSITRLFRAPRALVFDAWTHPEAIAQWWGPRGFRTTTVFMEPASGGVWKYTMHGPDGTDYPNEIHYEEVIVPERIVYSLTGGKAGGSRYSHRVLVDFREKPGGTEITMRMIFPSATERETVLREFGALQGMADTMDRLGEYVTAHAH